MISEAETLEGQRRIILKSYTNKLINKMKEGIKVHNF
jgi:hypothetical protein